MSSGIYNQYKADLLNKEVDMEADTIKVMLMNTSHSFTATDTDAGDVSANEMTGTGYTAGGQTLSGGAVTEGATTKFDATDSAWGSASFSAYHAVLYDTTNSNNLICSFDFTEAKTVSSGTFTVQWDTAGVLTLATA